MRMWTIRGQTRHRSKRFKQDDKPDPDIVRFLKNININ